MIRIAAWGAIAVLLAALVGLQYAGDRALRAWGVEPSRAVVALRVVNTSVVIGMVVFVFWWQVIA